MGDKFGKKHNFKIKRFIKDAKSEDGGLNPIVPFAKAEKGTIYGVKINNIRGKITIREAWISDDLSHNTKSSDEKDK